MISKLKSALPTAIILLVGAAIAAATPAAQVLPGRSVGSVPASGVAPESGFGAQVVVPGLAPHFERPAARAPGSPPASVGWSQCPSAFAGPSGALFRCQPCPVIAANPVGACPLVRPRPTPGHPVIWFCPTPPVAFRFSPTAPIQLRASVCGVGFHNDELVTVIATGSRGSLAWPVRATPAGAIVTALPLTLCRLAPLIVTAVGAQSDRSNALALPPIACVPAV
jgi:hypothetical protein